MINKKFLSLFLLLIFILNLIIVMSLNEKDFTFRDRRDLELRIRDYTQKFISCPNKDPNKEDVKTQLQESLYYTNRFDDTKINNIILECKEGKEAFTVNLKEKTPFLDKCANAIENKLAILNITTYKEFDVISECVIQEEFKERFADDVNSNATFFENLLEKRTNSAVNEIKLKEATHERTEVDDEEAYRRKLEQERKENNPSTFNSSSNYTLETFPEYSGETTENFLQRFFNYFKRLFNLSEWQEMQEEKKNKRLGTS